MRGSMTYKGSGVDIDAGDSLVKNIIALTNTTKRDGVMGNIGDFGGFFDLRAAGYKDPYLVSGTDGVGTKLKVNDDCTEIWSCIAKSKIWLTETIPLYRSRRQQVSMIQLVLTLLLCVSTIFSPMLLSHCSFWIISRVEN